MGLRLTATLEKKMNFNNFGTVKARHKVRGIEIIEREYSIELKSDSSSVFLSSIEEIDSVIDVLKYAKLAHHKKKFFTLKD
jgi:hypothetical protein